MYLVAPPSPRPPLVLSRGGEGEQACSLPWCLSIWIRDMWKLHLDPFKVMLYSTHSLSLSLSLSLYLMYSVLPPCSISLSFLPFLFFFHYSSSLSFSCIFSHLSYSSTLYILFYLLLLLYICGLVLFFL